MNKSKKILSGLVWKFSERFFTQIVTFIISMLLARMLLPEEYGVIAMVNVFIIIANVFATSGFSSALIQKKDSNDKDFSTIFYCSVILSFLIYLIVFFAAPFIASFYNEPALTKIIRVFGIQIPIAAYNSILNAIVANRMVFRLSFFSTVVGNIISGLIGLIFAYLNFGVWALVFQSISSILFNTVILNIVLKWKPMWYFSRERASYLLSFGWKILFADLIGTVFDQLSSFIIGKRYTSSELAFYNRGKQFPELISNNVDVPLTAVLFPAMSKVSDQPKEIKKLTRQSIILSTFFIAPSMIGLFAVAEPLVILLLTEKWLPAVPFLRLVCIYRLFATVNNANLQSIKATGRSDLILKLEFIKKPIYLILIVISSFYSVISIAVAQAIYGIIAVIINSYPNKTLLNYSTLEQIKDIMGSFINAIIMGVLIVQLPNFISLSNNIILIFSQITIGVTLYTILSLINKKSPIYIIIRKVSKRP